jgi:hypothetical protein
MLHNNTATLFGFAPVQVGRIPSAQEEREYVASRPIGYVAWLFDRDDERQVRALEEEMERNPSRQLFAFYVNYVLQPRPRKSSYIPQSKVDEFLYQPEPAPRHPPFALR